MRFLTHARGSLRRASREGRLRVVTHIITHFRHHQHQTGLRPRASLFFFAKQQLYRKDFQNKPLVMIIVWSLLLLLLFCSQRTTFAFSPSFFSKKTVNPTLASVVEGRSSSFESYSSTPTFTTASSLQINNAQPQVPIISQQQQSMTSSHKNDLGKVAMHGPQCQCTSCFAG